MSQKTEEMRERLRRIEECCTLGEMDKLEAHRSYNRYEPFYALSMCTFSDYSGCDVERSNARVLAREFPEWEGVVYGGYGTEWHGFSRSDLLRMESDDFEGIMETIGAMSNYPVLDDENLAEVEMELQNEAWSNWAESDFRHGIISLAADISPEIEESVEDYLDTIDDDNLFSIFHKACEEENEYWECETGGGMYIRLDCGVTQNGLEQILGRLDSE